MGCGRSRYEYDYPDPYAHWGKPNPVANFETTMGTIKAEIYMDRVPRTASNFINLCQTGFYNGLHFHRVIPGFVNQFGCPVSRDPRAREAGTGNPPDGSFPNLAKNGTLESRFGGGCIKDENISKDSNKPGSLSMANTGRPHSGGSQFFMNLSHNTSLDWFSPGASKHPVFGQITEGFEIAMEISEPFLRVSDKDYWRCGVCATTYLDPNHYLTAEEEGARYSLHENNPDDPGYRKFLSKLVDPLLNRLPPGSVGLDFGCGPLFGDCDAPAVAAMLRDAGHSVWLFDPNFAPDRAALTRTYDFITATEVVEHLHHPADEFDRLDALLRPGGLLAVMTSFQTNDDEFGKWHYRRDPTHVVFFREETFRLVAERRGWTFQLGWQVTRLLRNGSTLDSEWLESFAKNFGLSAVINVQLILLPVSRSSPVLRLLGVPSEGLVYVHRFLGIGTALLLATHGALFLTVWSLEGKLVKELLDWPAEGVANLPGELAFLTSVALYVFSRPSVRRRSFELFAYTHRAAAAAFFVGAALHWSGFLWFTLPGTLLYLADYAVHLRASKARVEHVRLNSGVLSLTLSCPPLVRGGRPLQWVMLKVPSISRNWHPFSLSGSPHDGSGTTVSLSIGVVDGGWTQALSERLSSADGVASTRILLSGCYGLGFDLDVYDAGSPLLLVCGGSGGTPFSALLGAIARRPAMARPPPITLVWTCRSRSELDEYVRAGDLVQLSRACDAISLVFHVSQPGAALRPSAKAPCLTLALSLAAAEGQTAQLAAPSAASARGRGRFDPHTLLALLCHACVPAGTIGGMAVGNALYPKEGAAPAQLVGFLLGACAGALAAHAGFACLSIDLRRCRARLRDAALAALRRAKVGGARTLPVHAGTRRVDELAAAPYACVMEADEAGADTRPSDADVREGRPDIETILQAFEARVSSDLAGGDAAPLEMRRHPSPCHTLVSGPPGLVREVSQAARSRGHVVHAVSFAL